MKLFIDTETTGIPKFKEPPDHPDQPHLVQLAAILTNDQGKEISSMSVVIRNPDVIIPEGASNIHGISTEFANTHGIDLFPAMLLLKDLTCKSSLIIAHNVHFDITILEIAADRISEQRKFFTQRNLYCTMKSAMSLPNLPKNHAGKTKYPKLSELYHYAFGKSFDNAHDAMADCRAMMRIYWWLKEKGL